MIRQWIGSPYFGYPRGTHGRSGHEVIAIVNHIMAGSLAGTDQWFQNNPNAVSAHFGVGRRGEVHQYVGIGDTARHAGRINKPSWRLIKKNSVTGAYINPNYYTIGIEWEGYPGDQITPEQYAAGLALHKWLLEQYPSIKPNEDTIIGHFMIDSINKVNCPGPTFPLLGLILDLQAGPFADVPADHWAAAAVQFCKDNNIMHGQPGGKFDGEKPPTRYELAAVAYEILRPKP